MVGGPKLQYSTSIPRYLKEGETTFAVLRWIILNFDGSGAPGICGAVTFPNPSGEVILRPPYLIVGLDVATKEALPSSRRN
jgi:hypothetical protein